MKMPHGSRPIDGCYHSVQFAQSALRFVKFSGELTVLFEAQRRCERRHLQAV